MSVEHLVKGEPDWHEKFNRNMDAFGVEVEQAKQSAEQAAATKVDKPVGQTRTEGYLYQNPDGSTKLVEGGNQEGKFKYSVIVDNGKDGAPSAVEYADDCVDFIEASGWEVGDWGNTKLYRDYFRPCVIQPGDGAPAYYLQQDDMTKKMDGSKAILTGADGDVMIEIKKLYGKFTKAGDKAKLSIMNYKEDSTCFCFNNIDGVEKDVVYRGAYEAGVVSGAPTVMRSISGVNPLVNITRATGRTYAVNRGTGYHQNNFYILMLYQFMYLLMYKNRDSQTCLGPGRSNASNTTALATGHLNNVKFCYGIQDGGAQAMKFLGCENFYGNVWEWVDGIVLNTKVWKATSFTDKYNDTGAGYEISVDSGMSASANNDKYITKLQLTKDLGFVPKASGGSSATFWCDNMWMGDAVQVVLFGGNWDYAAKVGAFCWLLYHTASYAHADIGSRLCRK